MRRHRSQLPCVQSVVHALRHGETNMIHVVLLCSAWFDFVCLFELKHSHPALLLMWGTLLELNSLWCLRLIPPFVCYRSLPWFSSSRHANSPCPCFRGWTSSFGNIQSRILNVIKRFDKHCSFHHQGYCIWFKSKQRCDLLPVLSWCRAFHGVHEQIPHSL